MFQFPLHRDPRCNRLTPSNRLDRPKFQFPLHRDPRCNGTVSEKAEEMAASFSSLYIGILAATWTDFRMWEKANPFQFPLHRDPRCNSERIRSQGILRGWVSVPFTSGSSLQRDCEPQPDLETKFQFPLHRDPRCNTRPRSA